MNKENIKDVVKQFYKARLSNNAEQVMKFFNDGSTFQMAGEGDEAYSSEAIAIESLSGQVEALVAAWEWLEISDQTILIEDNSACAMYTLRAIFNPTGEQISTQISDHIVVNDEGDVSSMIEFVDTALVARLISAASHREKQPSEYYP